MKVVFVVDVAVAVDHNSILVVVDVVVRQYQSFEEIYFECHFDAFFVFSLLFFLYENILFVGVVVAVASKAFLYR